MNYNSKLLKDERITILALSWRDIKSPTAGGAEVHTHEMLKRIDMGKYRVIHFAALYDGQKSIESIDGVHYVRKGNIFSVIWYAFLFYKKNNQNIDFVIEQCNTHRFFTSLWVKSSKRIFYIHQLTREIWDINLKFPWNALGKYFENIFLKLNSKDITITVSESTKQELVEVGFVPEKITIIPNGVSFKPWRRDKWCVKEEIPTFIYVGRYAAYKGINIAINSIGILKKEGIQVRLWILGKKDNVYIKDKIIPECKNSGLIWGEDVVGIGFVSEERKLELLSASIALLFPSIREGWGIPITEAGNVGTPSIAFNTSGIRDAVDKGRAGYLCESNDVMGLVEQMELVLENKKLYQIKQEKAYIFSGQFQWDNNAIIIEKFLSSLKVERGID